MAYFLNLFSPETWVSFTEHGQQVSGFSPRQRSTAQKIKPGDIFLCYLVGLSRWCGALRVASGPYDDSTPVFANPDPFTVRFRVELLYAFEQQHAVPVFLDELWTRLSLTRDIPKGVSGWAVNFRGSLRSISDEDAAIVLDALKRQATEHRLYPLSDRDKRQLARRASVPSQSGSVIVEVPDSHDDDDAGSIPDSPARDQAEDVRESLKIQAALARLGGILGFKVWIAPGDRKAVASQEGIESELLLDKLPFDYGSATMSTIEQIDVIWVKGRASIARAFEVEHTTAIYSGLLRMADLLALQPNIAIKLHIVAPDDKREKVLRELRRPVFSLLERGPLYNSCSFLSYSALEEIAKLKHLGLMDDSVLDEYNERADELS